MKRFAATALVGLLGASALAAGASAGASVAPLEKRLAIASPQGVDGLRLGATVKSLHRRHLIRRLRPGCELDPGQRVARLRAPLSGFAVFSHPNTRLSSLTISAGAETAKQIGIGSTPKKAQQAYPQAIYKPPGSNDPFAEGFVFVNSTSHPKMMFTVDPKTKLISQISVPAPNFCE
jgi:hypothetical protein